MSFRQAKRFGQFGVCSALALTLGGLYVQTAHNETLVDYKSKFPPIVTDVEKPPARKDLLEKLGKPISTPAQNFSAKDASSKFDLIIVGGGATGTGAALDATLRGLNVLLVEKNDFASGTSSKSTKMAHGGVRYLEKAIFQLSKAQLDLVIEALNERASILNNAPHLAHCLPIAIPVYKYWQMPYFYAGCLLYDLFAGSQNLRFSYMMTKNRLLDKHPQLDPEGLVGGLVYHDGLFNDSRMNVTLALTAIHNGATVLNYMEVKQILKNEEGKSKGVRVVDSETNNEYLVAADAIISATGPYSDALLSMDESPSGLPDPEILKHPKMVVPSGGVHIVLPEWYCARDMGLLDASTSDGRVMFFLPWQGKVLAGTTDVPLEKIPENPVATEVEINDILKELQHYVKFEVKREDVLSAWCGVRPLVRDPEKVHAGNINSTQGLVRNHLIYRSSNGLITISGGKWTTYREMAEEVINEVIKDTPEFQTKQLKPCSTRNHKLVGAVNYDDSLSARLAQLYKLTDKMAVHLASNYGDRAAMIVGMFKDPQNAEPLGLTNPPTYANFDHPFTRAELRYSMAYEYARRPLDFLARRCRLAFLDSKMALQCVGEVADIMAEEYGWSKERKKQYIDEAVHYIEHMGLEPNADPYGKL